MPLSRRIADHARRGSHSKIVQLIGEREATAKSSILLLGYAIELYLKAGLPSIYHGCSTKLFEKDVKSRYGHHLNEIATEIEFQCSPADRHTLRFMEKAILSSARYPLMIPDEKKHIAEWNKLIGEVWDDRRYKRTMALAKRIRKHVSLIDHDSSNPASYKSFGIDGDGYFAFRCGGRLRPRITVKYSTRQKAAQKDNKPALHQLLVGHATDPLIEHFWSVARFSERES